MFRLFHSNNPAIVFFLFFYALILKLKILWLEPTQVSTNLSLISEQLFLFLDESLAEYGLIIKICTFLFALGQAFYLNYVLLKNKFLSRQNYFAAAVYLLLSSMFEGFLSLSPMMIAMLFLIISLDKVLYVYSREECDRHLFDAGLNIGLASLFYPPFILLILYLIIAFIIMRSTKVRELIVSFFGAFVPFFLAGTIYFWYDQLGDFLILQFAWTPVIPLDSIDLNSNWIPQSFLLLPILITSFYYVQRHYSKSLIQIRKYTQILILLLLFSLISLMFVQAGGGPEPFDFSGFFLLTLPLSAIISYYWYNKYPSFYNELLHLLLFTVILMAQYFNFGL